MTRASAQAAYRAGSFRLARAVHPRGRAFDAEFDVASFGALARVLEPGVYRAQARLSKAVSTPGPFPDLLGLAFRVHGAGANSLDIALATAGRQPITRHVLVPSRSFTQAFYSSLLPYRVGDRRMLIGAHAERDAPRIPADVAELDRATPLVFRILLAGPRESWQDVASLTLTAATDDDPDFDVVGNALPRLQPLGWLNRIRGPVYRASQRGRHQS